MKYFQTNSIIIKMYRSIQPKLSCNFFRHEQKKKEVPVFESGRKEETHLLHGIAAATIFSIHVEMYFEA